MDDSLRQDAVDLLRANDRGGVTLPSPDLYPHQWCWDSAFCAMGWATFDPPRALTELERLLKGAWPSGMVPHIQFDPAVEGYEPGPGWWRTGRPTSSITQPPVAATALRRVLERAPELSERARALLPALEAWHRWFFAERDPAGEGLPAIIHPWESGLDNCPLWDSPLAEVPRRTSFTRRDTTIVAADQRPVQEHYERYAHLVWLNAERGFARPTPQSWPFLVQDVVLLSVLLRAERDLDLLGRRLGKATGAPARAARLERAIAKLCDPGTGLFQDHDLVARRPLKVDGIFGFLPLYAGLGGASLVRALRDALADPDWLGTPFRVPTVAPRSPRFEPRRYWRGPCWINTNWMLIRGLQRLGEGRLADELLAATLELVRRSGFREYYDPFTGEGLGAQRFGWSAALVLDLIAPAGGDHAHS